MHTAQVRRTSPRQLLDASSPAMRAHRDLARVVVEVTGVELKQMLVAALAKVRARGPGRLGVQARESGPTVALGSSAHTSRPDPPLTQARGMARAPSGRRRRRRNHTW